MDFGLHGGFYKFVPEGGRLGGGFGLQVGFYVLLEVGGAGVPDAVHRRKLDNNYNILGEDKGSYNERKYRVLEMWAVSR